MARRKVCVITGSRAEYGLLRPVMEAIRSHPKLELMLLATGMHLSGEFGRTLDRVREDGFDVACRVRMNSSSDKSEAMARSIGRGIIGMAAALRRHRPAVTLILGDRTEALAGAIASAYMNIPVAHIHGGDKSMAGLDESARHAITKLAHIHFPATPLSRARILRMGEDARRVHLAGAPGLDSILGGPTMSREELSRAVGADIPDRFLIVLQHSVTTQAVQARRQIRETAAAVRSLAMETFVIYPNSDAGGRAMIREIEKLRELPFVRVFKSMPHGVYLSLMRHASVLAGNSSSGIIEAPSFRLPAVNIGIRQEGRERSANVIDVPHDREKIVQAVRFVLSDENFRRRLSRCRNPYGDGRASGRIARALASARLGGLLQKTLVY